jgi:hypothetical protein
MEIFRSVLEDRKWDFEMEYPSKHFLIGSCFSEHIGSRLARAKFDTLLNPFGILYHPEVISRTLRRLLDGKVYTEKDLEFIDDRYVSFDHHGVFNHPDKSSALNTINAAFLRGQDQLKSADYCYITWGTSFAYALKKEGKIVSNCHKIPSAHFNKVRSTTEAILLSYRTLFKQLLDNNPKLKIILSVSPVKHLRDGIIENNLSKATLLLAADQLTKEFSSVYYFPSFELLQDDLRDYRFYAKDMAHPNEIAVDYIWEYFKRNLWSEKTLSIFKKIEPLIQSLAHRPLHPENDSYLKFKEVTAKKIRALEKEFPFLDLSAEMEDLSSRE